MQTSRATTKAGILASRLLSSLMWIGIIGPRSNVRSSTQVVANETTSGLLTLIAVMRITRATVTVRNVANRLVALRILGQ